MKVSILLSIHNDGETLQQCIKSIAAQTYKEFELIAVDDASSDDSLNILKKLTKKSPYKTIIISNKKNEGLTKSLNIGLKKCTGEVVARLDADDWWEKDKLEKQVSFLQKHDDYGYIGTFYVNHFEISGNQKKEKIPSSDEDIRKYKFKRNPFAHSAIMIRKKLLDKVNGYTTKVKYGQDYNLFMKCIPHTKFYNIPQFLCHRSVKRQSISIKKQKEQAKQSIQTRRLFMKKYGVSFHEKVYLIEPFLNAYTPHWIKDIKRKIL